jgi:hypothetical protein
VASQASIWINQAKETWPFYFNSIFHDPENSDQK